MKKEDLIKTISTGVKEFNIARLAEDIGACHDFNDFTIEDGITLEIDGKELDTKFYFMKGNNSDEDDGSDIMLFINNIYGHDGYKPFLFDVCEDDGPDDLKLPTARIELGIDSENANACNIKTVDGKIFPLSNYVKDGWKTVFIEDIFKAGDIVRFTFKYKNEEFEDAIGMIGEVLDGLIQIFTLETKYSNGNQITRTNIWVSDLFNCEEFEIEKIDIK